jgi:hypothetical protein
LPPSLPKAWGLSKLPSCPLPLLGGLVLFTVTSVYEANRVRLSVRLSATYIMESIEMFVYNIGKIPLCFLEGLLEITLTIQSMLEYSQRIITTNHYIGHTNMQC